VRSCRGPSAAPTRTRSTRRPAEGSPRPTASSGVYRTASASSTGGGMIGAPMPAYPERIVCLTAETAETLYLIGAGDRVVGRSVDAVRPAAVRDKPSVGGYRTARLDRIVALEPDLVLAFSDLQAELVAALVKRGYAVV